MMSHNNPSFEVIRREHKLSEVRVSMPVWRKETQGFTNDIFHLPLLGLTTYARKNDPDDAEVSLRDAILAFCLASEKFGLGLESELAFAGWHKINETPRSILFEIELDLPVLEEVLETGNDKAFEINLFKEEECEPV